MSTQTLETIPEETVIPATPEQQRNTLAVLLLVKD